jgi:hypothetical protein
MLLGNYSVLTKTAGKFIGGSTVADTRANFGKTGASYNRYAGGVSDKCSTPSGYAPGDAWVSPRKGGGMAAYKTVLGIGSLSSANLAGGLNGEAPLTGSGDISTAAIEWIIQAVSALSGSGALSVDITGSLEALADLSGTGDVVGAINAALSLFADLSASGTVAGDLAASLAAAAALTGSGDLAAGIAGAIQAASALTGSGTISNAEINAIWNMLSDLTGEGSATANINALAHLVVALTGAGELTAAIIAKASMSADIIVTGDILTAANVGPAVWGALASSNNDSGSMGEKLNDAGSASNPWTEDLSGVQTAGTAGYMLKVVQQILRNKQITNPATGVMTVYDDDGVTVLFEADLKQDAAGATPYQGDGAERRERLE